MDLHDVLNPTLFGHILFVILLLTVVGAVFRELARRAVGIILPLGVLMGLAVWLGVLDETVAGNILTRAGEVAITALQGLANWVARIAFGDGS